LKSAQLEPIKVKTKQIEPDLNWQWIR